MARENSRPTMEQEMNTKQKDERAGWTSASAAEADALCPGRHLLCQQVNSPEETSEAAASGTRIHKWLESCGNDKDAPTLTDDEQETADKCRKIEVELAERLLGHIGDANVFAYRELRLWSDFELPGRRLKHSGKADVISVHGYTGVIFDYKTGRTESAESSRNMQLRDLAVLAAREFKLKKVHVAIIQPWATMTPEVCTYEIGDLAAAAGDMIDRVAASNNPRSPRIAGEKQCRYCRAKGCCPEFTLSILPNTTTDEVTPEAVKAGVLSLSGERLGEFLSLVRLAEETASKEIRRRLDAGEPVNGWELKPGRETEKITDAKTVLSRALAAGITQDAFVSDCVTVGKNALKAALKAATGAKGRELDANLEQTLDGVTETKISAPVLTKCN